MKLPNSYAEFGCRPAKSARKNFYYGGLNVSFKTKSDEIDVSFSETKPSINGYSECQKTLKIKPVTWVTIFSHLKNWDDFLGTLKVASDRSPFIHELSYRLNTSGLYNNQQPTLYKIGVKTAYCSELFSGEWGLKFPSVCPRVYAAILLGHRGFFVGSKLSSNAKQPFKCKYGLKFGYLTKQLEIYGGYSSTHGLSFGIISSRGPFKCILSSAWDKAREIMCSSLAIKYRITDECFLKASLDDGMVLGGSIGFKISTGTFVSASILQEPGSTSRTTYGIGFDFEN